MASGRCKALLLYITVVILSSCTQIAVNDTESSSTTGASTDTTAPSLTIVQASGQADPASSLPVSFTVTLSEEVGNSTLTTADITQNGTASGITWTLTGSGTAYTLKATAVSTSGTIVPTIAAARFTDAAGNSNKASTSTDNSVTYSDTAAPTVTTLSPADNGSNVSTGASLTITFNEKVDAESGNIVIYRTSDDGVFESIPVGDARVSGSGTKVITIDPSGTLAYGTSYYVQIASTAFDDGSGNSYAGISNKTSWNFTTTAAPDVTAPTVSTLSPADNSTAVSASTNLVITFDENVDAESGNIVIYRSSDDAVFETIPVGDARITGTGTSIITVNPTGTLASNTEYYLQIAATAFDDTSGNSYAGISNTTSWSFTTADTTNPATSTLSPADNATSVSAIANLVITFDENVDVESGNIVIYRSSDDAVFETIPVGDARVTGTGTTTITINPTGTLASNTEYYVQIATTAFDDASGNSYAGISDTTSWTFTTAAGSDVTAPSMSTLSPADNSTSVSNTPNLVITFDEAVDTESGNIVVYKSSDDSVIATVDVTDTGLVSGTGTTSITIDMGVILSDSTEYYVLVDASAFDDASGNSYAGISSTTAWSFTTGDSTNPTVSTLSPADNATGVSEIANLVITFDEAVDVETGNIYIYDSDDTLIETIDVTSGQITGTGTTTITINPSVTLESSKGHYIQINATAFDDTSGNSFAGINDTTTWSFTTGVSATPIVTTLNPADDAMSVSENANLEITFNRDVDVETGNIYIYDSDNDLIETIDVTSGQVTGSGSTTITIDPTYPLENSKGHYIQIDATAFDDTSGNSFVGINDTTTWSFTTGNEVAPEAISYSPADDSTGVSLDTNLVITFHEAALADIGNIEIYDSDNSLIETIDVSSGQVSGSGTNTITINPSTTLEASKGHYIQIDSGAFRDSNNNYYAGLSDNTTWSFTTGTGADVTNPTVSSLSPADNATGVSTTANLVITFDEFVNTGSGNIVIYRTSDNNVMETIDVTSGQVTGHTGGAEVTINPSITLANNTEYYVLIDATAFDDDAGNSFAGISSTTYWSFNTTDTVQPSISSVYPADDSIGISPITNLVITADEPIQLSGSGSVDLYRLSDYSFVETMTVANGKISKTGATELTINPSTTLADSTAYYLYVDDGLFDDFENNPNLGIDDSTVWNFTTAAADATKPDVTINENSGQVDPANSLPVIFDVVFSEEIDPSTFTIADITQNGTASGITWTITDSGDATTFTLRATVVTGAGTLQPSIAAGVVDDLAGNTNTISTATDNTVTYTPGSRTITLDSTGCNDTTAAIGSASPPFCTVQAAVDEAIAANPSGTNPVVIEVANETFGTAIVSTNFGTNVTWQAISGSPVITKIDASGSDGATGAIAQPGTDDGSGCDSSSGGGTGESGTNGYSLSIISDGNITFTTIDSSGGNGGDGGDYTIDCQGSDLSGGSAGAAGSGGTLILENVIATTVTAVGGTGGSAGTCMASCGSASSGGVAADITLTNSTVVTVDASAGSPGSDAGIFSGFGADGSNIHLNSTTVTGTCTTNASSDNHMSGSCYSAGKIYDDAGDSSCGSTSWSGISDCLPPESAWFDGAYCDGTDVITATIDDSWGVSNTYSINWSGGSSGWYTYSDDQGSTDLTWESGTSSTSTSWSSFGGSGTLNVIVSDFKCNNITSGTDSAAYSD
ncbi:Ig-like domain-containing protein [bacterium]|nr:Ig-like domain-containing protein [bacterium]